MSAMTEMFRGTRGVALVLWSCIAACGGGDAQRDDASGAQSAAPASQTGGGRQSAQTSTGTGTAGKSAAPSGTQAVGGQQPMATAGSVAATSSNAGGMGSMRASASAGAAAGTGLQPTAAGTTASAAAGSGSAGLGSAAPAAGSGAAGSSSSAQKPCPASNTLKAGDNRKTLNHGGRERRFNVYVPTSIMAMTPAPLVLDFHGNGSSGSQEQSGSGWRQKADAEHFIVAYPDGIGNGWNVGNCCGEALNSMVDDVGFARAMVENISSEACVDVHRVYATGISNGAGLAHRLACEAADVFAAIAAASADLVTDPCKPARPISEISIRGLSDTLVAYEGGNTGSTGWYSPGAKGTLELWKNIDGCSGMPSMSMEYCETYNQCMAGVEVTLCSLPGTGHILYTNNLGFSVPDTAWEMFKRQTLP